MIESTIYTHKIDTSKFMPEDLLACYGSEQRKCEDLLTLGYSSSNGINLSKRIKVLAERIDHLTKIIRGKRHG